EAPAEADADAALDALAEVHAEPPVEKAPESHADDLDDEPMFDERPAGIPAAPSEAIEVRTTPRPIVRPRERDAVPTPSAGQTAISRAVAQANPSAAVVGSG